MSHVLLVTCNTCYMSQTSTKKYTKDSVCQIFMDSSCKIKFNGHDKKIACHLCYMSHVTHVTCHKYYVTNILPKTQCVIYFWKAHVKYSSMVLIKALHVTHHNATSCRQLNVESTFLFGSFFGRFKPF